MSLIRPHTRGPRVPTGERPGGRRWLAWVPLLAFLLALAPAPPVAAQEQNVAGRVLSADSRQPLTEAQVQVVGTQRGVLSNTAGRFLLLNLSGNEVTLRVTLIGYRTLERTVSVGDMDLTLLMEPTALELDQIVVTGTPGAQRIRSLGNAVGTVEAGQITEISAPSNIQELIGARVPGVSLSNGMGGVGSGGSTALRGVGDVCIRMSILPRPPARHRQRTGWWLGDGRRDRRRAPE